MMENSQASKHHHVLEDYDRGRKVIVITRDPDFNWRHWLQINRQAIEAAEEFSKVDAETQASLQEFLGSLGIQLR